MARTKAETRVKALLERVDHVRVDNKSALNDPVGLCDACGALTPYRHEQVINDALAREWQLDKQLQQAFSARESRFCAFCGCSYRLRMLARAMTKVVTDSPAVSLKEAIAAGTFKDMKVAEINSCGKLHAVLQDIPDLHYSEYGPTDAGVPHEDLMALSYEDDSFDIVLTSDTLEHVPDIPRALGEINRVLKPGGVHVFTVPWILTRETVVRTRAGKNDDVVNVQPPSFHGSGEPDYLVWNEIGWDFISMSEKAGFSSKILFQRVFDWDDPGNVFLATKGDPGVVDSRMTIDGDASKKQTTKLQKMLSEYGVKRQLAIRPTTPITGITPYRRTLLEQLAYKLALTEDHANNQTARLEAAEAGLRESQEMVRAKSEALRETQAELNSIHASKVWKAWRAAVKARRALRSRSK